MFTGIVEEVGVIRSIRSGAASVRLEIAADLIRSDLHTGDSISVNGVCLTADVLLGDGFAADVMPQTMRNTALGQLHSGSRVNLERAMRADSRFGGHIVSGHIDGTGTVTEFKPEDNAIWMKIHAEPELMKYIVQKGSVAVDGVSLTVAELHSGGFSVSLIPHTAGNTILTARKPGDMVNLECDTIAKYVWQFLNGAGQTQKHSSKIDLAFLAEHGFH